MSRILLADDSPHAQRMGERILADEGYEVVTVSDGDSALVRLEDVDPDLVRGRYRDARAAPATRSASTSRSARATAIRASC